MSKPITPGKPELNFNFTMDELYPKGDKRPKHDPSDEVTEKHYLAVEAIIDPPLIQPSKCILMPAYEAIVEKWESGPDKGVVKDNTLLFLKLWGIKRAEHNEDVIGEKGHILCSRVRSEVLEIFRKYNVYRHIARTIILRNEANEKIMRTREEQKKLNDEKYMRYLHEFRSKHPESKPLGRELILTKEEMEKESLKTIKWPSEDCYTTPVRASDGFTYFPLKRKINLASVTESVEALRPKYISGQIGQQTKELQINSEEFAELLYADLQKLKSQDNVAWFEVSYLKEFLDREGVAVDTDSIVPFEIPLRVYDLASKYNHLNNYLNDQLGDLKRKDIQEELEKEMGESCEQQEVTCNLIPSDEDDVMLNSHVQWLQNEMTAQRSKGNLFTQNGGM